MTNRDPIHPLLKRLAARKIIDPLPEQEADPWWRLTEYNRLVKEGEAERLAKLEAEAQAKLRAQPTAKLVGETIALNGQGVLDAAAAGMGVATTNSGVADFIRGGIQRGWN